MEILKIVITLLLQISLIAVAQNSTQSENNHDKITQLNLSTESDVTKLLENSTIQSTDNNNLTSTVAEKTLNDTEILTTVVTSTTVPTTTTDMLIPPATVEAQIEKLDVTSKKPSRLTVIASQ